MSKYTKLSLQKYKYLQKLNKNSYFKRKEERAIVQGEHQVLELLKSKANIVEYLLISDNYNIPNTYKKPTYLIDRGMAHNLSIDKSAINVAAVVTTKNLSYDFNLTKGLYICLVNVQDPFNMGSIFRTAEAFGVKGVILAEDCVDPFNNKVIASSTGSVFKVPFTKYGNCLELMNANKNTIFVGTSGSATKKYNTQIITDGVIIFGNEGKGLDSSITSKTKYNIKIPIKNIDSLNLSVSVGIIIAHNSVQ